MKKTTLILITIIGLGLLYSCEKQLKDPVLDMSQAVEPTILAPENGSEFILLEENADSIFATFQWTAATYDLSDIESVKYIIYMDIADSSFNDMKEIGSTTETSFSLTVAEMNSKLLSLKLETGVARDIEFKVYAYINNETTYSDLYSTVFTFNATPYESSSGDYPKLWVPGDYQGWSPADAPNIYSFNNDGIFTGYLYFPEGGTYEFKFTSDPDWDHTNYGVGADSLILDTDPGAGNLTVPGPGGYQVVVDINNLTWSYTAENWGVIGEFTSWAEDIDMEWDAENNYLTLTYDVPDATDNRFKFRANDSWDVNLGDNDPPDGFLVQGGVDIPIPAPGVYTFNLILDGPVPTYEFIAQ
ncbi:MAG: SusE domain-containing protein [Bacteroidales bacterium]|nr:SusE domain-containing protein [Bacteroidales bacterium]